MPRTGRHWCLCADATALVAANKDPDRPADGASGTPGAAATDLGIVKIVKEGQSGQALAVINPEPINQATRRLIAVLDESAPGFEDVAFAVLADSAGVARPHLHGWEQRRHRARLSALRRSDGNAEAAKVLRQGCKAIMELSRLATADPRTIGQQIGLTPTGQRAAKFFGSSAT